MSSPRNPFATSARNAKRDRIVAHLDLNLAVHGRLPFGDDLVAMLRAAPEAFWERVGAAIKSRKAPSLESRELVLKVYETRTEGDRLAREYLARTLGTAVAA